MRKLIYLFIIASIVVAIYVFQGEKDSSQNIKKEKVFRIALGDEPPSLDVSRSTDTISFTLSQALFEGLYRYHKGKYIPGMAKGEPLVSEDGLKWIFKLKDALWSDGIPVKADDFVYSWLRALNPDTGSKYAFIISDYIEGAAKYNSGKGSAEEVKVRAVDDKTIEVILKRPTPYFKSLTSFGTYLPLRRDIVEKFKRSFASDPEKMVYNGPFILEKWSHDSALEFVKNERYWNKKEVNFDRVISPIVRDASTRINMFEAGELDITGLVGNFLKLYEKTGRTKVFHDGATFYLMFNTKRVKALSNPKIRKALSLSLDRENYIKNVYKLPFIPATNFVNPAIQGDKNKFRDEYPGKYFDLYSPEKAKKLLAEGLREEGVESLPKFDFLIDDGETSKTSAEFIQENWRKNLGIEITISPVPFKVRLDRTDKMEYDVVLSGWGPDYDDPMTFMDMWISGGTFNEVKYSNKKYDDLIFEAKKISDNRKRMEIMAKAEKILMTDLPIVPLYHRAGVYITAKGITGIYRGAFNPDPDWMFADKTKE